MEFPNTNRSPYLSQDYQTHRITLKRAIFWNPSVRATISHTSLDFQNHHATTLSGHVLPNTSCTRNQALSKASYQDLHPKLCRIPCVIHHYFQNRLAPRSTSPSELKLQVAWCCVSPRAYLHPLSLDGLPHAVRRHTSSINVTYFWHSKTDSSEHTHPTRKLEH